MFSTRTGWDPAPNRLTRLLAAKRSAGNTVIDLTESNPTRCGLPLPTGIASLLQRPEVLEYTPEPLGMPLAREAISADYRRRGVDMPPENLILTAGTSEAYSHLLRLFTDPGDSILAPAPSYPLFDLLARFGDVQLGRYGLDEQDSFAVDFESVEVGLARGARLFLAVNPGNPSGTYLTREELARISQLCSRFDVPLVCDEVFGDFTLGEDGPFTSLTENPGAPCVVLNGISKMLALPQMKLAWIGVTGPAGFVSQTLRRLEVIADTWLSVGTPIQLALPELLEMRRDLQEPLLSRIRSNRALLERMATSGPCHPLPAAGGWSSIVKVARTRTDEEWALRLLERDGVLVHPGYFFDFPAEGHLVMSLLPPRDLFEDGLSRLLARCSAGA